MRSDIPYVGVLTQYKPYSLMDHIGFGEWWGFTGRDRTARVLPPYTGEDDSDWYAGTADAIWQNRNFIKRFDPEQILVLSGDHIYHMDYRAMIDYHIANKADLTIALQQVPWEETSRFGLVEIAENGRVKRFQEKPKKDPVSNLASLGIYVFDTDVLLQRLLEDASLPESSHDFGKDVIPAMLNQDRIFGYVFDGYWRDVGTIQSFWEANLECLDPNSPLDLQGWGLRTNYSDPRLVNDLPARISSTAEVRNSYIGRGCVIEGEVDHCVIFPGVRIAKGAVARHSILMNNVSIGPDVALNCAIADKNALIDRGSSVGVGDNVANEHLPSLTSGISVIGKGAILPPGTCVGKNVLICPGAGPADLPGSQIASGTTVVHNLNGRLER